MNADYAIQKAIYNLRQAGELLKKADTSKAMPRTIFMLEAEMKCLNEQVAQANVDLALSFGGKKLQLNLTQEQTRALLAQLGESHEPRTARPTAASKA